MRCGDCGVVVDERFAGHVCSAPPPCTDFEPPFLIVAAERAAAHAALDRWLAEVERQAPVTWEGGQSGYLGRLKLTAHVQDEGITLRAERSFEEHIG